MSCIYFVGFEIRVLKSRFCYNIEYIIITSVGNELDSELVYNGSD